jgi:F0F1-type ATP synthase assembly protein I
MTDFDDRLKKLEEETEKPIITHDAPMQHDNAWGKVAEFIVPIVGGIVLGIYLDKYFHTSPLCLIIFLLLGCGAGFIGLLRETKRQEPPEGNP